MKPGDDFYQYSIGSWLTTNQIPADRTSWSTFVVLADEAEKQLRQIVEGLPANAAAGSNEQKVGDFYRAYLDTDAIEKLGLAPVKPALDAIASVRTYEDVARLMGRPDMPVRTPVREGITVDQKNPDRYIVAVTQSGLGLPERDYYLKDDPKLVEIRAQYEAHIERLLTLAGEKNGADQAKAILDLETQIAKLHWPIAKRRERDLTYNLRTREELEKLAPIVSVAGAARRRGHRGSARVRRARARRRRRPRRRCSRTVPVATWRSYLTYHFLATHGGYAAQGVRRRALRVLRAHAERPAAAARSLEARDVRARWQPRRSAGAAVRREVLPAGFEGEDARAGREPAHGLRGARERGSRG